MSAVRYIIELIAAAIPRIERTAFAASVHSSLRASPSNPATSACNRLAPTTDHEAISHPGKRRVGRAQLGPIEKKASPILGTLDDWARAPGSSSETTSSARNRSCWTRYDITRACLAKTTAVRTHHSEQRPLPCSSSVVNARRDAVSWRDAHRPPVSVTSETVTMPRRNSF